MEQALLEDFFEEENTHWWHTAKRKMIGAYLPKGPGRILVLGVGGGLLCHELSRDFDVVAVDISDIACRHVKDTYGLNAIVCDIGQGLPFHGEIFDVVIIADVLEHIQDDKKVLSEIRRCLTKGGILLLTVPAYQHMWSYWDERLHHCRRYEYKALKSLIGSENFQIRKITFFNALIYPAAFIKRKLIKTKEDEVSDFKISQGGGIVNRLIGFYYAAERAWTHIGPIPFGLSLFVCAQKS